MNTLGVPVMASRIVNRVNYSRVVKEGNSVFSLHKSDKALVEILTVYEELKNECSNLF